MHAKEFLSQALYIDDRISSKICQTQALHDMATKATSTISEVPPVRLGSPSGTRNFHRMEDVICKMIDLENEINADVAKPVDLKREIGIVINRVSNPTYRKLLELRCLCFKTWDDISFVMHYDRRYVLKVHGQALYEADTKRHFLIKTESSIIIIANNKQSRCVTRL